MLASRRSVVLRFAAASRALVVFTAVGLVLSGCAKDEQYRQEAYATQTRVSGQAIALNSKAEPELEEDGLPSQMAPPANRRQDPDDPREPFSPNYGKTATPPLRTTSVETPASQPSRASIASAN
jgi:hypothetical protein